MGPVKGTMLEGKNCKTSDTKMVRREVCESNNNLCFLSGHNGSFAM